MTPEAEELQRLAIAAAELIEDLDGQRAREAAAFAEGYRLGFGAGDEVGYRRAEWDMHRAWAAVAAKVRSWASRPTGAELEARRTPDRTPEDLARLRGRDRYPLPDREAVA